MIEHTFNNITLDALPEVTEQIIAALGSAEVWAFYGEMGVGKTTLIKQICTKLGVHEPITSPTFSLVNEYTTDQGNVIYHFDFYRIKNLEEVYDIGYEDYFYSGNLCLIEWPEKISDLLAQESIAEVHLLKLNEHQRTIRIKH